MIRSIESYCSSSYKNSHFVPTTGLPSHLTTMILPMICDKFHPIVFRSTGIRIPSEWLWEHYENQYLLIPNWVANYQRGTMTYGKFDHPFPFLSKRIRSPKEKHSAYFQSYRRDPPILPNWIQSVYCTTYDYHSRCRR